MRTRKLEEALGRMIANCIIGAVVGVVVHVLNAPDWAAVGFGVVAYLIPLHGDSE